MSELRTALESPPHCVCPPRLDGHLYTAEERVRSPNERGSHCLWCGLVIVTGQQRVFQTEFPDELVTLDEMERRYVRHVLGAVSGNKTHAARILGIDRRSLYRKLKDGRDHKS
jgi:transcriptional regulator with GAF, ATPase, and Fis domain